MSKPTRPYLAKLQEDYPKIKNEHIGEIDGTINYIFALLNIQFKPEEKEYRDAQCLVLSEFLVDKFNHLTTQEVKNAFKMYAAKEFPELKTYRILDCLSLGEILNAYIERRNQNLHTYNQKKILQIEAKNTFSPSEDDIKKNRIKGLKYLYESLQSKDIDPDCWIYYSLVRSKIKMSNQEMETLYKREEARYLTSLKKEAAEDRNKKSKLLDFVNYQEKGNKSEVVKNICRSIVLSNFLKPYLKDIKAFLKVFDIAE